MVAQNLLETLPLSGRSVAVAGLFRTRSGLQRGTRLMLRDLRRRGYMANAIDLSAPLYHGLDETDAGLLLPQDLEHLSVSELIVHISPPLFSAAIAAFPETVRNRVRITGYWVWELPVLSDEWRECASLCSAIWAPSPFVAEALEKGLPDFKGQIVVVPHQVDLDPVPRSSRSERLRLRSDRGLQSNTFVCGATFSFLSNFARKNPMGAIEAFTRAFPAQDTAARLFIRAHDSAKFPELHQQLLHRAADDSRVIVFDPAVQPWPITDFFNSLDVFLSLHRSEGYGLQMAEAAQAGVAVIATRWGLAPDIADRAQVHTIDFDLVEPDDPQGFYSQFPGAIWAEPSVDDAASRLRTLRSQFESQL